MFIDGFSSRYVGTSPFTGRADKEQLKRDLQTWLAGHDDYFVNDEQPRRDTVWFIVDLLSAPHVQCVVNYRR